MIELGPGLAAVLGGLTGGAASFGATWIDGKLRRDAEREARQELAQNAEAAARDDANADLIAAAQGLIATASVHMGANVDRDALRDVHARIGEAATRASLMGPSADTAKNVLYFADRLVSELRANFVSTAARKDMTKIMQACDYLSSNIANHLNACISKNSPS